MSNINDLKAIIEDSQCDIEDVIEERTHMKYDPYEQKYYKVKGTAARIADSVSSHYSNPFDKVDDAAKYDIPAGLKKIEKGKELYKNGHKILGKAAIKAGKKQSYEGLRLAKQTKKAIMNAKDLDEVKQAASPKTQYDNEQKNRLDKKKFVKNATDNTTRKLDKEIEMIKADKAQSKAIDDINKKMNKKGSVLKKRIIQPAYASESVKDLKEKITLKKKINKKEETETFEKKTFEGKPYAIDTKEKSVKVIAPKEFKGLAKFKDHLKKILPKKTVKNKKVDISYFTNIANAIQDHQRMIEEHQRMAEESNRIAMQQHQQMTQQAADQAMRDSMNAAHMANAAAMNSMNFGSMPMGPIM